MSAHAADPSLTPISTPRGLAHPPLTHFVANGCMKLQRAARPDAEIDGFAQPNRPSIGTRWHRQW